MKYWEYVSAWVEQQPCLRGHTSGSPPQQPGISDGIALCILLLIYTGLALPFFFISMDPTWAESDFLSFHQPQIEYFIEHPFAILDYPATTAMTPGHHLMFGLLARAGGYTDLSGPMVGLRGISLGLGVLALLWVWQILYRLCGRGWVATILSSPLAVSQYLITSALWLVTDHTAALAYVGALWTLISAQPQLIGFGLMGGGVVLVRQLYFPIVLTPVVPPLWSYLRGRGGLERMGPALLAMGPALGVGMLFFLVWGGLTPPDYQGRFQMTPMSLAVVTLHGLCLVGLLSLPFGLFLLDRLRRLRQRQVFQIGAISLVLGILVWGIAPSSYDPSAYRFGSLVWRIAAASPLIADRALVLLPVAVLGMIAVQALLCTPERTSDPAYEVIAFLLYGLGYVLQPNPWQRYLEIPLLVTLAIACARQASWSIWALGLVSLFTLLYGAATLLRLYG